MPDDPGIRLSAGGYDTVLRGLRGSWWSSTASPPSGAAAFMGNCRTCFANASVPQDGLADFLAAAAAEFTDGAGAAFTEAVFPDGSFAAFLAALWEWADAGLREADSGQGIFLWDQGRLLAYDAERQCFYRYPAAAGGDAGRRPPLGTTSGWELEEEEPPAADAPAPTTVVYELAAEPGWFYRLEGSTYTYSQGPDGPWGEQPPWQVREDAEAAAAARLPQPDLDEVVPVWQVPSWGRYEGQDWARTEWSKRTADGYLFLHHGTKPEPGAGGWTRDAPVPPPDGDGAPDRGPDADAPVPLPDGDGVPDRGPDGLADLYRALDTIDDLIGAMPKPPQAGE